MEVCDWIERSIPPYYYAPWLRRTWPGFGLVGLTWPTGTPDNPPFRLNQLYWPRGASRHAFIHLFASAATADQIRGVAFAGGNNNTVTLKMDDDGPEHIATQMYLLPPYPLSAMVPDNQEINNAYILTLVDQRYYWWYKQTPLLGFADSTTWTQAFNVVSSQLGITVNVDTINSAYLNASPQLNLSYEVIPPWFDALAANVGQVVVVKLDGSVWTQNYQTALSAYQTDFQNNPNRVPRAGGDRLIDTIY